MTMRPDWDTYFMDLAKQVSTRATCRVQVGGVVAIENRLVLTGYNGSPPGLPHCVDWRVATDSGVDRKGKPYVSGDLVDFGVGCEFYGYMDPEMLVKYQQSGMQYQPLAKLPFRPHCQRTIHVEQNICGIAAREGINLEGATWYFYPFGPCHSCQRLISTTRPKRVVWRKPDKEFDCYSQAPILAALGVELDVIEC